MARAGRGWQGGLSALVCAGLMLLPTAGQTQTEVKKTVPAERPPAQSEVKKGVQENGAAVPASEPPGLDGPPR